MYVCMHACMHACMYVYIHIRLVGLLKFLIRLWWKVATDSKINEVIIKTNFLVFRLILIFVSCNLYLIALKLQI